MSERVICPFASEYLGTGHFNHILSVPFLLGDVLRQFFSLCHVEDENTVREIGATKHRNLAL